ncbi:MAG: hypothetical protein AB8B50_09985 [Pirellulaceae bacterium]
MSTLVMLLVRGVLIPCILAVPSDPERLLSSGANRTPGSQSQAKRLPPQIPLPVSRIRETVDLIELNHFYDDLGRHSYDQVIFYEWSHDYARFHVIAWCLVEQDKMRLPRRDPGRGDYFVNWNDRDDKVQRIVRSKHFQETWSQVDPERSNRKLLPEKYRLCLLPPRT